MHVKPWLVGPWALSCKIHFSRQSSLLKSCRNVPRRMVRWVVPTHQSGKIVDGVLWQGARIPCWSAVEAPCQSFSSLLAVWVGDCRTRSFRGLKRLHLCFTIILSKPQWVKWHIYNKHFRKMEREIKNMSRQLVKWNCLVNGWMNKNRCHRIKIKWFFDDFLSVVVGPK